MPEPDLTLSLVILVVLLCLAAFFSAAETAIVALSPARIRDMLEKKTRGAAMLHRLKTNPHRLLITILIGSNLVNVGASVYATLVFEQILGSSALGIITGVLTLLILVFGEIVPKSLAQTYSKAVALLAAPLLQLLLWIFTPAVWILDLLVKAMLRLVGAEKQRNITEDELKAFVSLGAEEGTLEKDEKELIENVLEFNETRVEEVMVPRVEIKALPLDSTLQEAADFMIEHRHSRIPVYNETVDDIVGIITVKDMLAHLRKGRTTLTLKEVPLMKPIKVPASQKINPLFDEFQKRHLHIAVVLDEHGGTAGLITLEDILEEIVGEIEDEFDEEEEDNVRKIGSSEVEANGKALIEEIQELLDVHLDAPEHKTLSYYITEKLGRFPKRGEILEGEGFRLTVDEMNGPHTIAKVSIEKLRDEE